MALIKTPAQRQAEKALNTFVKILMVGPAGLGKTFQARTLEQKKTLFINIESGTLALNEQTYEGTIIDIHVIANHLGMHPWEIIRAICLLIAGPDPADLAGNYSAPVYAQIKERMEMEDIGFPDLSQFDTIYVDSISRASVLCLNWARTQPEAFSEKTGKEDMRGAYGLKARDMLKWSTHFQTANKNVVLVGILDEEKDELGRKGWSIQVEGNKTSQELPGIFDEIITLQEFHKEGDLGESLGGRRRFCCHRINPDKYPAKDRSGTLEMYEPAHLGKLIKKIQAGKRLDHEIKEE